MVRFAKLTLASLFGALGLSALDPGSAPSTAWFEAGSECRCPVEPRSEVGHLAPPAPAPRRVPPCPAEMAQVGATCVDRHEASLVTVDAHGIEHAHPYYERPLPGVHYEARSTPGVLPQAYVSRIEAEAACDAAGKRLCSASEWRRACQGSEGRRYPYGNEEQAGACNNGKEHLFSKVFGHNPSNWTPTSFNSPALNQEPGFLTKTGERAACCSPDGVYDMVGNVHEWVSDTVTLPFMDELVHDGFYRHPQPWRPGNAMFMGGFYATKAEHGPGCHFVTVAHNQRYHDYSTGFRCCRDAHSDS